jgi:hypothetical protein
LPAGSPDMHRSSLRDRCSQVHRRHRSKIGRITAVLPVGGMACAHRF